MPVPPARASRDISRPSTSPTCPIVSSATSRANPGRSAAFAATAPGPHRSPSPGRRASPARPPVRSARTAAGSTRRDRRPAGAKIAGRRRPPAGHDASPGFCHRRAHAEEASCSPPAPSAGMGETASRSRSMLSNPRTRPVLPPETTSTVPSPGPSSAPSSGEDARAASPSLRIKCLQPSGPPTSRSRPSRLITGVLTSACPTIHAL